MKKIILMAILAVSINQLKAQQLWQTKSDVKLSDGLQVPFKLQNNLSADKLLLQPKPMVYSNANASTIYSTMPIAKAQSNDNMPVAVPDERNTKYTMMVKKIAVVNPLKVQPVLP